MKGSKIHGKFLEISCWVHSFLFWKPSKHAKYSDECELSYEYVKYAVLG